MFKPFTKDTEPTMNDLIEISVEASDALYDRLLKTVTSRKRFISEESMVDPSLNEEYCLLDTMDNSLRRIIRLRRIENEIRCRGQNKRKLF